MKKILYAFSILLLFAPLVYANDVCKEINEMQFLNCCKMSDRPTALNTIYKLCEVTGKSGEKREIVAQFNRETGTCKLVSFNYKLQVCVNEKEEL